MVLLE